MKTKNKPKIAVAMSGGVDSSVAAYLLKEEGYDVFGITMVVADNTKEDPTIDAQKIADFLEIPLTIVDLKEAFHHHVIEPFKNAYEKGETPNPCIVCNEYVKFGVLLEAAKKQGAELFATGHYVKRVMTEDGITLALHEDSKKDQTYMLYRLSQDVLEVLRFPLAEYEKTRVREIAKKINLPIYEKGESQEICFIPGDDYKTYLKENHVKFQKGDFVHKNGTKLGTHEGIPFYTVGQRKGLGISFSEPLFVIDIDPIEHKVMVGVMEDTLSFGCYGKQVNLMMPLKDQVYDIKIRYSPKTFKGKARLLEDGRLEVLFQQKQRAVTKGQSVVLYDGEHLVGGAFITKRIENL